MNALDARNKLTEIQARLAALQALFMYDTKDKEFGQEECWGIDLTIQTIVDRGGPVSLDTYPRLLSGLAADKGFPRSERGPSQAKRSSAPAEQETIGG